VLNYFPCY